MSASDTCLDIDDVSDTVFVAAWTVESFPDFADFLGVDGFAVWPDLMLGAEVQDFLGGWDSSDD